MTDDEILLAFMQSDLNVRDFAQHMHKNGVGIVQLVCLREELMRVAYAKISGKPIKYTIEFYRCGDCTLPHRIVYKHLNENRCTVCKLGDTPNPRIVYQFPDGWLSFMGTTTEFMGTVIHAMNIEVDGIPMQFDQDYLDTLKAEIVEHDYTHL